MIGCKYARRGAPKRKPPPGARRFTCGADAKRARRVTVRRPSEQAVLDGHARDHQAGPGNEGGRAEQHGEYAIEDFVGHLACLPAG